MVGSNKLSLRKSRGMSVEVHCALQPCPSPIFVFFLLFCCFLFTPCFNHFLPDMSSGHTIISCGGCEGDPKTQVQQMLLSPA